MNDFFRNEAVRKSPYPIADPGFEVMRAAHCRVPTGDILGEQFATYARVVYCLNGALVCSINYCPHMVGPNQAAVALPGGYISCHTPLPAAEYQLIAFDGHSTSERFRTIGLWSSVFHVASVPSERFSRLLDHLNAKGAASVAKATNVGQDMLALLEEEACMFAENRAVFKIQQFFQRHWRDPEINVSSALADIGISYSSISGRFQQLTGHTMLGYLTCIRLHQACLALKRSAASKTDIAVANGFSDPAYFCRVFKKSIGMTPSRFADLPCEDFHALMRRLHARTRPVRPPQGPEMDAALVLQRGQGPAGMALT